MQAVFWRAGNFGQGRQVQPPCSWRYIVCSPAWQVSDGVAVEWVVTPEQVCRELKTGRQEALPCLCRWAVQRLGVCLSKRSLSV